MYQRAQTRCRRWDVTAAVFTLAGAAGLVACDGAVEPEPDRVEAVPRTERTSPAIDHVPGQLLVRFKSGTPPAMAQRVNEAHEARLLRSFHVPSGLYLVELPPGVGVPEAIARYRQDPSVRDVQPNHLYHVTEQIPDDPRFGELWGMNNPGTTGVLDADIDAPEAWDITTGSPDVILGVLDTGVEYDHEDLAGNVFSNPGEVPGNGVDDDGNGYIDDVHGINAILHNGDPRDDNGHGTHVSGTIAARGNNGIGVAGVNWEARVLPCKAFDAFGSATEADILTCLQYFLDLKTRAGNPVDITATNNSWTGPFSQPILDAVTAHAQAGILLVAAAGNFTSDNDAVPAYPASYELANVIAVAATNERDELASFSNYGRRSVDVGAPGERVLSTFPRGYEYLDGTSMAAPHVTGLLGLIKASDPNLTPGALRNLVLTGGDDTPATLDRTLSGRRINAFGSLTCQDRTLVRRFAPAADEAVVALGRPVALGVLSIDCAAPSSEPLTVTVRETGEVVALADEQGAGSFTASWTPMDFGTFTLEFSTGDVVTVHVVNNYDPARVIDFAYRDIDGAQLPLYGGDFTTIPAPFPIRFGNVEPGYESINVGAGGVVSFTDMPYDFGLPLPSPAATTIVAPFWSDLRPDPTGGVFYEVLGSEPARELVIEWREMLSYSGTSGVTFQVVFFEGSPNILFSYADVEFGDIWVDRGRNANVGVQVAPELARQYSFFDNELEDQMTLFWGMGTPLPVAGPDQVVLPGATVTLDASASRDFDGTIAFHGWTQIAGTPVLIQGANTAVATFTAPQESGTLTFQLSVVDDDGNVGTDTVDVIVNRPPVADAGADHALANLLTGTLDGTGSTDPDGMITGYQWRQVNGEPVEIRNAETAIATFTAPATPQHLAFELTVTDEHGFQDSDLVVVEIFHNDFPVAAAGADRLVRPGDVVTLDATGSQDPDGTIAAYAWEVVVCMTVDGPCDIDVAGADTATPTIEMPGAIGFVTLRLTVTDEAGATASDTVTITAFPQ
jgi:subtilisin family serine protease